VTRKRKLIAVLNMAVAVSATAAADTTPTVQSAAHHTGTLPNGTIWVADVPADWHGPLVLYSHSRPIAASLRSSTGKPVST
jgi:hypothetical protein